MYPRVRELVPELEDDILESYEEHHVADVLVAELAGMAPDAERFDAWLHRLLVHACYAEARQWTGREMTVAQVMAEVERDVPFYEQSGGGVTFSGGEPMLQRDFLQKLVETFAGNPDADGIIPRGNASFSLVRGRYDYHDEFFMTSRCMAYRREVMKELGGFVSNFVGQEDVEFVIRFTIAGKTALNAPELTYYHHPLLVPNLRKPKAVGASFCQLRGRYSVAVWLLMLANCARHARSTSSRYAKKSSSNPPMSRKSSGRTIWQAPITQAIDPGRPESSPEACFCPG